MCKVKLNKKNWRGKNWILLTDSLVWIDRFQIFESNTCYMLSCLFCSVQIVCIKRHFTADFLHSQLFLVLPDEFRPEHNFASQATLIFWINSRNSFKSDFETVVKICVCVFWVCLKPKERIYSSDWMQMPRKKFCSLFTKWI